MEKQLIIPKKRDEELIVDVPSNPTQATETIDIGNFKVVVPKATTLEEFATAVNADPEAVDMYELEQRQAQQPPSEQDREASYGFDRTSGPMPRGSYQIGTRAERMALLKQLKALVPSYERSGVRLTMDEIDRMVKFIPNSRFFYINKLIKKAAYGIARKVKTLRRGDLEFIDTVWMNPEAKDTLLKLISPAASQRVDGFQVRPTYPRSGVRFSDAPGEGLMLKLKNPGDVYLDDTPIQPAPANPSIDPTIYINMVEKLNKKLQRLNDDLQVTHDFGQLLSQLPDNAVQNSLAWFVDKVSDNHISYKDLVTFSEQLQKHLGLKRSKYLLSLANPWKHHAARIPTLISPPSACFQIRSIVPLTTNALGNVAFVYNPNNLQDAVSTSSTLGVNNNVALTGVGASNFFLAQTAGQTLPADFYVRYRLVSAGIRLFCYPSSNNDNGIATISVTLESIGLSSIGLALPAAAQFGDFGQIENGYYKKTTTVASREVQEHVYIPIDESALDYLPVGTRREGFSWAGYITGASPSSTIARLELISNFEALLDNQYTDYLPSESPLDDIEPKYLPLYIKKARDTAEELSPRNLEKLLADENTSGSIVDGVQIPITMKQKNSKQQGMKDILQDLDAINKALFPLIPQDQRTSVIEKVMQFISPIAQALMQNTFAKFLPYIGFGL